jgi:hypothetical protein
VPFWRRRKDIGCAEQPWIDVQGRPRGPASDPRGKPRLRPGPYRLGGNVGHRRGLWRVRKCGPRQLRCCRETSMTIELAGAAAWGFRANVNAGSTGRRRWTTNKGRQPSSAGSDRWCVQDIAEQATKSPEVAGKPLRRAGSPAPHGGAASERGTRENACCTFRRRSSRTAKSLRFPGCHPDGAAEGPLN